MIANMLEGMEHEETARLAGLSRSAAYDSLRKKYAGTPSPKHGVLAHQLYHIWGSPEAGITRRLA
jgi:hypothetical protein